MVCTFNIAAPHEYYTSHAAYLADGAPAAGVWYAPSSILGLEDRKVVDPDELARLSAGLDHDGKPLGNRGGKSIDNRVSALDMTFSPPKSVPIVLEFCNSASFLVLSRLIEEAHIEAVRDSLVATEELATWARRGTKGSTREKVNFAAALYTHYEGRPAVHSDGMTFADMNIHTHAYILNISPRADGTFGALHTPILRQFKMTAGAIYHASLSSRLQALGLEIEVRGPNGMFEIVGVDDKLISYFSGRRNEIVEELSRAGVTSTENPALAAAAAKKTRRPKQTILGTQIRQTWADAAKRLGVNIAEFVKNLFGIAKTPELLLYEELLASLPRRVTENRCVVNEFEILRQAHADLVGTGLPISHAKKSVDELLRSNFVHLGTDVSGFDQYSTADMVNVEKDVVRFAIELASEKSSGVPADIVKQLALREGLSEEQTLAALDLTRAGGIALLAGAPGSGKSTTARPIVAAYKSQKFKVIGAAVAWKTANMIRDDLSIESLAWSAWLAKIDRGEKVFDKHTVILFDEAGLLSARETHRLLSEAKKAGAKVILIGDPDQLQPIGAGSGLDLIMRAILPSKVRTIVRQRHEWARNAVVAIGEGRASDALSAFVERGLLKMFDRSSYWIAGLVDERKTAVGAGRDPLILVRTNAHAKEISRAIRRDRRQRNEIGQAELSFKSPTISGHLTEVEVSVGDPVRFLIKSRTLGVVNGDLGLVEAFHQAENLLDSTLTVRVNERVITFPLRTIADARGNVGLNLAYCSTNFSGQGATVDHAIVAMDAQFDMHNAYVACSRARLSTTIICDGQSLDVLDGPKPRGYLGSIDDRLAILSRRLKRRQVKASTLDPLWIPEVASFPLEAAINAPSAVPEQSSGMEF